LGIAALLEALMSLFGKLKINTKFNLILSVVLIALFLVSATWAYKRQQSLILKIAVDNARVIARQIIETRDYISSVVRGEPDNNYNLVPQVVATQVAKKITQGSKYYVRQVSLRYRNPGNRPDEYETMMLRKFAGQPVQETSSVVESDQGKVFRFMLPMVAEKSCLECHGEYDKAPVFVRDRFPAGHYSYNYKLGEVIGAVSVSIPMVDLYHQIGVNLEYDIMSRGVIIFLILLIMGLLVRKTIINPIRLVSATIIDVTRTGNFAERLSQTTGDEIGHLIGAFNDLMEELDRKTLQSRESEERYRKFIEMAKSAVVTFMEDGKIVISNQKAEDLLGLSRQALLGENIFRFIEDGEALHASISAYGQEGKDVGVREITRHNVKNFKGQNVNVDIAVSVSWTNHIPMFTVILRETGDE
jgi:PAS domain S-box-containing protein